jgi:hypothetical protein
MKLWPDQSYAMKVEHGQQHHSKMKFMKITAGYTQWNYKRNGGILDKLKN